MWSPSFNCFPDAKYSLSRESYRRHIESEYFLRYKKETEHMVKSLVLSDQTPLNEADIISNFIQ